MRLKPIVNMLLMFSVSGFASGFKFTDLDKIIEKNSSYFKSKIHNIPKNHQYVGKFSYYGESENSMFINNKHRYRTRSFDLFTEKAKIPHFHTKLFFDSNPRYSLNTVLSIGAKKMYAMEE